MNQEKCPQCEAPMRGKQCEFCGYRIEEKSPAPQEELPKQAAAFDRPDRLIDKADFLDAEGQLKLALMYCNGVGVNKSEKKAAELFRKSALGGNKEAMFRYAESLRNGLGIEKDEKQALRYYALAAQMGHCGARCVLRELSDAESEIFPVLKTESAASSSNFEEAVNRVRPFCVEFTCFEGNVPVSQGSGCLLSSGLVITNAHVIMNPEADPPRPFEKILINFDEQYDDKKYPVLLGAVDVNEDIAVCVLLDECPSQKFEPPRIGTNASLQVGKEVFTIGNGLGRGLGLSRGVISRDVEKNAYGHREVVRTDMSVNPGNSGGPLFNGEGEVIGMMTFVATQSDHSLAYGMSYAVTADTLNLFFEQLGEECR